jgi:CRISPR/Cas system-associated exonuclease Cas4 (RecB family)
MQNLSKSKLLAFRQCPKRLWLEVHRPELRADTPDTEARFRIGHQVGGIARRLYDPNRRAAVIDAETDDYGPALARNTALLSSSAPIFEAGFAADGALAFADIMLPQGNEPDHSWRAVEVKSSTSVKDYHRDEVAIQAFVMLAAGVPLSSIALAHIDSQWLYPGEENYQGLLIENDLTSEAFERADEVRRWIDEAHSLAQQLSEPRVHTGAHCSDPYECNFRDYCQNQEPQPEYPVEWLPRVQTKAVKDLIKTNAIKDLRDVPDEYLNDIQRRVKAQTLSGMPFFDRAGAAAELAQYNLPFCFVDFETIQFAVPIWKGTRPYQQIPFQFSRHGVSAAGKLDHSEFLDLSGDDPSLLFAEAMVAACGQAGPVFVYNAAFETARLTELAERFPNLRLALLGIAKRVVDLLPVARRYYYHPAQKGSWSIKSVLPTIATDVSYTKLDGVQDGGMAMLAYLEAIQPQTASSRRDEIHRQLLDYCSLDTYALFRMWRHFSGRNGPA